MKCSGNVDNRPKKRLKEGSLNFDDVPQSALIRKQPAFLHTLVSLLLIFMRYYRVDWQYAGK